MIFVTTGTLGIPFKRLVDSVVELYANQKKKVVIQSGSYIIKSKYKNIFIKDYFPFWKTLSLYRKANIVVSSCGEASVFLILKYAKNKPIFFPRLPKHKEHIDNQQLQLARFLEKNNLAKVAYTQQELANIVNYKRETLKKRKVRGEYRKSLIKALDKITL